VPDDQRLGGVCLWLTGPPGSGKTTIARAVVHQLEQTGVPVVLLDEDERANLAEGIDPVAWFVGALVRCGITVVVAADVPRRDDREHVRDRTNRFAEVFVDGGRPDDDYEEPFAPELRVPTRDRDPAASIALVTSWLEHVGAL
jgi:adenylylsulfate kinase-like enzyme